jgi:hypothetical protein
MAGTRKRGCTTKRRQRGGRKTRKGGMNKQTMWHTYQARKHTRRSQELANHIWVLWKEFGNSTRRAATSAGQAIGSLL